MIAADLDEVADGVHKFIVEGLERRGKVVVYQLKESFTL